MKTTNRVTLVCGLSLLVLLASSGIGSIPKIPFVEQRIAKISRDTGIPIHRVKITEWRPDTCDCTVEYAWDRDSDQALRVHYPVSVVDKTHAPATMDKLYDVIVAENRLKNRAVGTVAERYGIDAAKVAWSIDSARRITVTAPGRASVDATVVVKDWKRLAAR